MKWTTGKCTVPWHLAPSQCITPTEFQKHCHHPKGEPVPCPLHFLGGALGARLTCSAPPMGLRWAGSWIWPAGRTPGALWHDRGPRGLASQWSETVWSLGFHERLSAISRSAQQGREQRKRNGEQLGVSSTLKQSVSLGLGSCALLGRRSFLAVTNTWKALLQDGGCSCVWKGGDVWKDANLQVQPEEWIHLWFLETPFYKVGSINSLCVTLILWCEVRAHREREREAQSRDLKELQGTCVLKTSSWMQEPCSTLLNSGTSLYQVPKQCTRPCGYIENVTGRMSKESFPTG